MKTKTNPAIKEEYGINIPVVSNLNDFDFHYTGIYTSQVDTSFYETYTQVRKEDSTVSFFRFSLKNHIYMCIHFGQLNYGNNVRDCLERNRGIEISFWNSHFSFTIGKFLKRGKLVFKIRYSGSIADPYCTKVIRFGKWFIAVPVSRIERALLNHRDTCRYKKIYKEYEDNSGVGEEYIEA